MLVYSVRLLAALLLRSWLRVYHQLCIVGREHLPTTGLCAGCQPASHLDASHPRRHATRKLHRVFPAAAEDYFVTTRALLSAVINTAV